MTSSCLLHTFRSTRGTVLACTPAQHPDTPDSAATEQLHRAGHQCRARPHSLHFNFTTEILILIYPHLERIAMPTLPLGHRSDCIASHRMHPTTPGHRPIFSSLRRQQTVAKAACHERGGNSAASRRGKQKEGNPRNDYQSLEWIRRKKLYPDA